MKRAKKKSAPTPAFPPCCRVPEATKADKADRIAALLREVFGVRVDVGTLGALSIRIFFGDDLGQWVRIRTLYVPDEARTITAIDCLYKEEKLAEMKFRPVMDTPREVLFRKTRKP